MNTNMNEAPLDRPFLARFSDALGGDVKFCQARPAMYGAVPPEGLSPAEIPRWDTDEPVFFADVAFEGWTELPEGFTNVQFKR